MASRPAWLQATNVLATTLRDYIALQKKHQDELRLFADKACKVLEETAASGSNQSELLNQVSALFAHAASAPDEMCVNLPIDIQELQEELNRQEEAMDLMRRETEKCREMYDSSKNTYVTSLTTFHDSFEKASRSLSTALDKGIDPAIFKVVDSDNTNQPVSTIKPSKDSKLVGHVMDAISRAKRHKDQCLKEYKDFRKVAGEYATSLDSMSATHQAVERDSIVYITSIVKKFIVSYFSVVKNIEYDLNQVHASVEEEQAKIQVPARRVGHAATIHQEMQMHPPPLGETLELSYFLEQYFPTTHVRPLLVRHQPRAQLHLVAT
ncbi:unnamed protein product [Aphanomyces euteiches]|uniref:Uncharacterized protein n=1 Tax=Aphanomyces euteiches TaxID=100861 RepID=A0A6G0XDR1_9STRA|nr:hypothetical protein Ae201684_006164 [Aphanomyces euteiches]KAH9068838.1 hypothetical protein Ae201684P_004537 [Aphanomyces euteiches]KAH9134228.1 hypothetical protein AeRB84_019943 [Aphanomyces euteiches]